LRLPDGRWLVARAPRFSPPPAYGWGALLVALGVAVAIGAFPLVRRLTRRLERLQRGVEALGAGDLSARVPVQGRDEVAALAASFNRSAGRIESLVRSQRSLLANASHELRSPLARLKMAAALLADADGPDSAAQRAGLRDEVGRNVEELDALVDEILLASRLDAEAEIVREPVDLAALVAQSCARADVPFEVQGDADGADSADGAGGADGSAAWRTLRGDARLLRRLVGNLLDNARRHGAGPIEVVLRRVGDRAELDVTDRGPGVPEAERERIFEPFHRVAGHAESSGGTGLGLALVRQIAMRHGATAQCLPREGGGTRMRVVFG
jgi:signal transduction histidine kinase